jgi:serine/threonine-protein kinase RsbW
MVNHSDWAWTHESRLPSVFGAQQPFLGELLRELARHEWSDHEIFGIHLAAEEALVNAIRHGNRSDRSKQVHVVCKLGPKRVLLEIADEGPGFNPAQVPDCTAEENMLRPSGRGILLMRNYMSRVEYIDGGNRVVLEKHRSSPVPADKR